MPRHQTIMASALALNLIFNAACMRLHRPTFQPPTSSQADPLILEPTHLTDPSGQREINLTKEPYGLFHTFKTTCDALNGGSKEKVIKDAIEKIQIETGYLCFWAFDDGPKYEADLKKAMSTLISSCD